MSIPGMEIPLLTLLFLGMCVGVLSGFTGVGGGFFITPALIVLGMPADHAVATSLFWVFFNSLASTIIHRNHGNSDIKLGIAIALPALFGVEAGIQLSLYLGELGLEDVAILSISIVFMAFIGAYTIYESLKRKSYLDQMGDERNKVTYQPTALARKLQGTRLVPLVHFKQSGVTISFWIILFLGFLIGTVTGFLGTGGGIIYVPVFMYLLGMPSVLAVGSSTMPIVLSSLYGGSRYLLNGEAVVPIALVILCTSIPGVLYGVSVIQYVRGVTIRLVLGMTMMIVCAGSAFKLGYLVYDETMPTLQSIAHHITLWGMLLAMMSVVLLKFISLQYRMGKRIPAWTVSLFR